MQDGQQPPEDWQQPHESSTNVPHVESHDVQPTQPPALLETTDDTAPPASSVDDEALLRWEGTEYIHQERSILWFIIVGVITLGMVLAALFLLHSYTFALLIPVMAVALFVYVRRPPEVVQYILSRKGLHIGDRLFTFDQFKSFGIVTHQATHSVALVPRKRFQIAQTIYFPEEIGEQLVDFLAARLPMKEIKPDLVDQLLARIHL